MTKILKAFSDTFWRKFHVKVKLYTYTYHSIRGDSKMNVSIWK